MPPRYPHFLTTPWTQNSEGTSHTHDHVNVPNDKYSPPLGSQSPIPGQPPKSIGDEGLRDFRVCAPLQDPAHTRRARPCPQEGLR